MILKIGHLIVYSDELEKDVAALQSKGYQILFRQNIGNLEIKKDWATSFPEVQDVAFLTAPDNFSIELIGHKDNVEESNFIPIIEDGQEEPDPRDKETSPGQQNKETSCFRFPVFLNDQKTPFQFNKLLVKTKDLSASMDFWKNFGFQAIHLEEGTAQMEFKSILSSKKFFIYLKKSEQTNPNPCLDNKGISCVSFITNSAQKEKEKLDRQGIKSTPVGEITVNGKLLHLFFVSGPNGEIVEVIEIVV